MQTITTIGLDIAKGWQLLEEEGKHKTAHWLAANCHLSSSVNAVNPSAAQDCVIGFELEVVRCCRATPSRR